MASLPPNKQAEIESHARALEDGRPELFRRPFGRPWGVHYWIKWGTIADALEQLEVPSDAAVLDVGCGAGWTTAFLAESGYRPVGIDLAPAHIEMARMRADRWGVQVRVQVADMDDFDLGQRFHVALVFDALHHSEEQPRVIANIARHLHPGGWVIFGEPSLLHKISPGARRVHRESGWIERGIGVRRLKRDCAAAGLGNFRRFFEGTGPYESRTTGFLWQLLRLIAANVAFAPGASVWLAAQWQAEGSAAE